MGARLCRFCNTARVRIFNDAQRRAWVFDADAIDDERTEEFCTDPPRDVYVVHAERRVNRNPGPGQKPVQIFGWVKPAADSAPTVVREAGILLRLHVCAQWLAYRARRRQEERDKALLGNMTSIGAAAADFLDLGQVDEGEQRQS